MDYQSFVYNIRRLVEGHVLPDETVKLHTVMKTNDTMRDALVICSGTSGAVPAVYLDTCYRQYQNGAALEQIAGNIIEQLRTALVPPMETLEEIKDFSLAKDSIVCSLTGTKRNTRLLEQSCHSAFLNLSVIYYYLLDHSSFLNGIIRITPSQTRMWNIAEEELQEIALQNTKRMFPLQIQTMKETMQFLCPDFPEEDQPGGAPFYVMTNRARTYGAYWMSRPEARRAAADIIRGDYYILPSSVHEVLMLPCDAAPDAETLLTIVAEINRTQVAPEEVLADCVYRYDIEKDKLFVAAEI